MVQEQRHIEKLLQPCSSKGKHHCQARPVSEDVHGIAFSGQMDIFYSFDLWD